MSHEMNFNYTGLETDLFFTMLYAGIVFFAIFIPAMILILLVVTVRSKTNGKTKDFRILSPKSLLVMSAQIPINLIITLVMFTLSRSVSDPDDANVIILPILISVAVITLVGSCIALMLALMERRLDKVEVVYSPNAGENQSKVSID